MTSGKGSRTARKGCRLRTLRQQVQSQYRSPPREESVAATPLAALPGPNRIASPQLRPWRDTPHPAPRPRRTPLRQKPPESFASTGPRHGGLSNSSAPRPDRARCLLPGRPGRSGPAARFPQPRPRRGPAHLHLFAEVARPRYCQRPGAAAAATRVAPASRPRHDPGAGSRGALGPSVRQSLPPPYAASAALAPAAPGHTSLWPNLSPAPGPHPPLRPQKHHPSLPPACLRRRRRLSTAATAAALRNRGPGQPRSGRHDGLRHVT